MKKFNAHDTRVSRRTVLQHVAAAGAAAMSAFRSRSAFGATSFPHSAFSGKPFVDAGIKPTCIDVHHHMLPPFYMDLRRAVPNVGAMPAWSPEKSLEDMGKNGVSKVMLSLAVSGVAFDAGEAGRSLARKSNEYGAQLVSDHAASFRLLAALPLPDPKGSLAELAYAMDTLRADGIALLTSYGDKWLGDPEYAPVFEELNRRKVTVFVHPNAPNCCTNVLPHVPASTMEFLFDTTRTIESLLMNGTFARYPAVKFIFSHGGGAMPMLANRLVRTFPKDYASQVPNGVLYELKRQYYDTASASNPTSLNALLSVVPTSQVVFGSDFPFISAGEPAEDLARSGLSGDTVEAIEHGNAERLFPRLKT